MTKIMLGKTETNGNVWLTKHKWDCGWYWGFGYLGNLQCHYHFSSVLENNLLASKYFSSTNISDKDWWVIRDLFEQAYALRRAYEVYYRGGGHQSSLTGVTDVILNKELAAAINKDLEGVLDRVWAFTCNAIRS